MKKGVFIVIDGSDGSGKATQTKLLVERLQREGLAMEQISFPQYGQKSAGPLEEYLSGKYGQAVDVGPYCTSVLFAVDRFDAAPKIKKWLDEGKIVVADRFVSANMGHQGSKIKNNEERREFFKWEMEFEHNLLGLPRPDFNIILHVPAEIAKRLIDERDKQGGSKHGLTKDIHESDPDHLYAAERAYLDMAEQFDDYLLVSCAENNQLLSREVIHEKIWEIIKNKLNL